MAQGREGSASTPRNSRNPGAVGARKASPLGPSGAWPAWALTSAFWAPELRENTCLLFQATQFLLICHSSHRKVTQNPSQIPSLLSPFDLTRDEATALPVVHPPWPITSSRHHSVLSPSSHTGPFAAPQTRRCSRLRKCYSFCGECPSPDLPGGSLPLLGLCSRHPYLTACLLRASCSVPSPALFPPVNPQLSKTL